MKTTAKGTLLIVDGDATTRRIAEVGLRHAGYRVTVAGSPEQALWFLERASPDAVLTAVAFDGEPLGWDLVRILRSRPDGARMAVIVLVIDPAMRADDTAHLADDLVSWPAGVRELELCVGQALVRRRVGMFLVGKGERRLTGDLEELSPIDLLTLIERSHTTGTLEVEASRGPATLWFSGGRIIDAHFGRFVGQEAIFQLLIADAAEFEWTIAPHSHAQTIEATMADTIADNLRRLDEWTRLCDELPDLATALRVDPQRLRGLGSNLAAEQVALVERCNGRRSIRDVIEGSEIDPLLALEVLRNLLQAGALASVRPTDSSPGVSAINVDELPPLPAFPEPFPGTSEEFGLDAPLVSGIPDLGEFLEEDDAPVSYVFRPPGDRSEPSAPRATLSQRRRELSGPHPAASSAGARPRPPPTPVPTPVPVRRHDSVRIPLVDGRVEPPAGIKQAEATGEFELAPSEPPPRILRRRQSILFRRVRPEVRRRTETVRSSRRDVMSPSGLISAGELVVEHDDPATAQDDPADATSLRERFDRWAAEGPEQPLLAESEDDLGRLSAMAAQFAQEASGQAEPAEIAQAAQPAPSPRSPGIGGARDSAHAAAPRPPLAVRPEPALRAPAAPAAKHEAPTLRGGGWILAAVCVAVVILVVALRRPVDPGDASEDQTAAPATAPARAVQPPPTPAPVPERVTRTPAPEATTAIPAAEAAPPTAEAAAPVAEAPEETPEADASARDQEAASALFTRANTLYRGGKLNRARRAVDRALQLDPNHAEALVLRANIWLEQGMLSQALNAAQRAVESDPTLAEGYLTLGVVAQEKRAWAESLAAYERYLELAPDARYAQSVRRQVKRLRRKLP